MQVQDMLRELTKIKKKYGKEIEIYNVRSDMPEMTFEDIGSMYVIYTNLSIDELANKIVSDSGEGFSKDEKDGYRPIVVM